MKIGVEISLVNMMSKELTTIVRDMLGFDKQMAKTIQGMGGFKTAVVGIGAMAFGAGILEGMEKIADKAGELEKQLSLVKNQYAGMTDEETKNLRQFSITQSLKSNSAVTPAQMAETVAENFTIFKNLEESKATAAMASQIKGALAANLGMSFEEADNSYKALIKAAELHGDFLNKKTGQFDATQGMAAVEDRFKLMESSRGQAKANDILMVEKQASNVLGTMNYRDADRLVAGLIQPMGGARLGTALQAFGRQFYGGKMTESAAEELVRLGIMKDGSWSKRKGGGIDMHPGAFFNQDLLDSGKVGEFMDNMRDKFHAAFLKNGRKGQSETAYDNQELGKALGTDTERRLMFEWFRQKTAIEKESKGVDQAQTSGEALANAKAHNLDFNKQALGSAWNGFLQVLGGPAVPVVIQALHGLTDALKFITSEVQAHPTVAKELTYLVGGIGALLVVGGGIATFLGAISVAVGVLGAVSLGPIALGIAGIGGAIVGLHEVIKHRTEIVDGLNKFQSNLILGSRSMVSTLNFWQDQFFNWSRQLAAKIPAVWDTFKVALTGFFDKFTGFFSHIGKWLSDHMPHFGSGNSSVHEESFKYVPSGNNNPIVLHASVQMNGKMVGKIVLDEASKTLSRDNAGQTGFNTRANYTPSGIVAL